MSTLTIQPLTSQRGLSLNKLFEEFSVKALAEFDTENSFRLRMSPGNRLEALKGNRKGQWSIRINDQFRICFRWTADGPEDVEIVDYH